MERSTGPLAFFWRGTLLFDQISPMGPNFRDSENSPDGTQAPYLTFRWAGQEYRTYLVAAAGQYPLRTALENALHSIVTVTLSQVKPRDTTLYASSSWWENWKQTEEAKLLAESSGRQWKETGEWFLGTRFPSLIYGVTVAQERP
jgi:hypothetical protein